jgi:hypothetical protein
MNYKLIYDTLILKASTRNLGEDIYFEVHHILPRCLGGTNNDENLVKLTAEEHYLAHQLLVKIYPEESGLIKAAIAMSVNPFGYRNNNKSFAWLRKRHSESMKGRVVSDQARLNMSKAQKGKTIPAEQRAKMSESAKKYHADAPPRAKRGKYNPSEKMAASVAARGPRGKYKPRVKS